MKDKSPTALATTGGLTVEVSPQLGLFLPAVVQPLDLHLLPQHFIFLLDLQVAVQLREPHRGQLHLSNQRKVRQTHLHHCVNRQTGNSGQYMRSY